VADLRFFIEALSPKTALLRLEGEFEGMAVYDVKEALLGAVEAAAAEEILVDFEKISYIDSSGVGVLLEMAGRAAAGKKRFGLVNVKDPVKKVLQVTKVDKVLPIYKVK